MAECMGEIEDLDLGKIESDQVLNQLECPVCYDYIIPPVKQCKKIIFVMKWNTYIPYNTKCFFVHIIIYYDNMYVFLQF